MIISIKFRYNNQLLLAVSNKIQEWYPQQVSVESDGRNAAIYAKFENNISFSGCLWELYGEYIHLDSVQIFCN